MSTESAAEATTLRDDVESHLDEHLSDAERERATVETVDAETGTVVLSFGCGCSGGLAPGDRARLRTGLTGALSAVTAVSFQSGCGCGGHGGRGGRRGRGGGHGHGHGHDHGDDADEGPKAPF
jgi:hypothetical protein